MTPEVNEVILSLKDDAKWEAFEGLTSNFFVLTTTTDSKDGSKGEVVVETAPSGTVLEGTIARLVRKACEELGLRCLERHPDFYQMVRWTAPFITSTSRLVLPVVEVRLSDQIVVSYPQAVPALEALAGRVEQLALESAVSMLD